MENAEETLRKRELNRLWSVYSQSPISTIIVNKAGQFVKYNDAMVELTGYTHDEVADINSWLKNIYPDEGYREYVRDIVKKSMNSEIDIKRHEFLITRKDGEQRHVAFSVYDISHGRKPTNLQVVQGEDITERKRAEEKLKKYQLIVESAQDAIFFKDLKSRYIYVNNKTAEAFGLPCEKIIGKNDYEITTKRGEAKKNIEDDQHVFTTGKTREITEHMTGADGREYWFQAIKVPQFDDKGNIIGLVGIARDITDLKKSGEALIKSENKYRELAESISDVFFAMDRNFTYTYWNKASERLTGIPAEEALGKSLYIVFPNIRGTKAEKFYTVTIEQQKPGSIEYNHRIGETDYIFEINAYPTKEGISIFVKDVTKRKHIEDNLLKSESELRKQKLALEQKNIALREVIAQVEVEKNNLREDVITNVNKLVIPVIEKLKINDPSNEYFDLLRNLLEELTSSFGRKITDTHYRLTPRELEISTMVERGLINKEMSRLLNISCNTIEKHRENIRKKLGITNKNINLRSYLKQLYS